MIALQDLASPVAAFVRDRCLMGPDCRTDVDSLYKAFRAWAEDNGHARSTKQVFGRDLRAARPDIRVERPRADGERRRVYAGIALKETG
jgi:putative DNA primase/helicase